MNKTLIVLVLAIAIQVAVSAPQSSQETALRQTKRFKLIEFAYDNLRKTVWPAEVYPLMTEYMNKMQEWCDNDETLKELNIYNDLEQEIGRCLSLLKALTAEPGSCGEQMALSESHEKIRTLFDGVASEKIRHDWAKKYMNFSLAMRVVIRKSYEQFYTLLAAEVDSFLNNLDGMTKATDVSEWQTKFSQESDFMKKQWLVMEFMRLFPEERVLLETKCKIQYKNDL